MCRAVFPGVGMTQTDRSHVEYQDGRRPPERVPKSERILNLIAVLLRADKPLPVTDILGKVTGYNDSASRESLMRRFERDKKVLRDIGIPIEHATQGTFGQEGYSISRKDYFLEELHLPPESGRILRLLYAMAQTDGGELSADLRSALVKVGFLVAGNQEEPAPEPANTKASRALKGRERISPDGGGPEVGRNLEVLSEAVLRRRRVKFRYYSMGRDEEYEVEVDPWGLGFSGQAWEFPAWYMVGHSHLRQESRTYKVLRIRGPVTFVNKDEAAPDFETPMGFRVREHLGKTRWEWEDARKGEPTEATVGFERALAPEVRALVPSATPIQVPEAQTNFEYLRFEMTDRREFLRFLLRFVPRLDVVAPVGLEEELRDLAREVIAIYEEVA